MRAAFIPALPPSALLAGMIAPSFRLVNRFCGKKLLRTCGRRERPHALCPLFSWYPLACGRVPSPPSARCGMGRLCGERGTAQALRAPAGRKKRVSPHPAPKHPKPPRSAPAPARSQPQPATSSRSQPHPAARPAPSPSLPHIYPRIYVPRPGRFGCPAARVRSCRGGRVPPSRPPKGARGKRPLPRRKSSSGAAFSAAPTSAQPPFSSRSRSPWHTAPRRWCGCHGRDTAAGRARFGRGRIRNG